MTPLRLVLSCALGLLLLTPPAAAGGGWWTSVDVARTTVAPGHRVEVKSFVDFSSVAAAEEARERLELIGDDEGTPNRVPPPVDDPLVAPSAAAG